MMTNDGIALRNGSPVSSYFDNGEPECFVGAGEKEEDFSWYKSYDVPYDYLTGRDLMRLEGYSAQQYTSSVNIEPPPVINSITLLVVFYGIMAIIVPFMSIVHSKRKMAV